MTVAEVGCNFHQNLVLCKVSEENIWDAFGFFGGGWSGKSSLSFSLGKLLVERDGFIVNKSRALKIIDDNFTLENGMISTKDWGDDKTGKCHEFVECVEQLGGSAKEAQPRGQTFKLGYLMGWFIACNNLATPTIKECNRDEFVNQLLRSNPCHSPGPSQTEIDASPEIQAYIRDKFALSWDYSIVTRRNTHSIQDAPVLEGLASRAYEAWHPRVSRYATPKSQKSENRGVP